MKKPVHAITFRYYEEFAEDVNRLSQGGYRFLLVIGNSGLGKTKTVERILQKKCAVTSGCPTPWGFYKWCFDNRDKILVLDDVTPRFFKGYETNALLKNLTDTVSQKTLRWTSSVAGDDRNYPQQFQTTSRVIVMTNSWESVSEHVRALEGRATTIVFDPSPTEVHREVAKWFTDQEVFDFIWENRRFVTRPDIRLYVKSLEHKNAGSPWRKRTFEMIVGNERLMQVALLLQDPAYTSNAARQEAFTQAGYGSRSTFYELYKEFRFFKTESVSEEPIKLQRPVPDSGVRWNGLTLN